MKEIMNIEDLNASSWNQHLNAFLNLLNLSAEFLDYEKGLIKDQKSGEIVGKSRILPWAKSQKNLGDGRILQSSFLHPYGNIRIRLELKTVPNVLLYQINREKSVCMNGVMHGHLEKDEFLIDNFNIVTTRDFDEIQEISLLENTKDFCYHSEQTNDKIIFRTKSAFTQENGMNFLVDSTTEQKKRLHATILANHDDSKIEKFQVYDRKNGEHLETESIKRKLRDIEDIEDQFACCMSETNIGFYDKMQQIIDSYEWNGFNIAKTAINKILLPHITSQQATCIFGKTLVKEITSSSK